MKAIKHVSFKSKILYLAVFNLLFYYISYKTLLVSSTFTQIAICVYSCLIVSSTIFRFLCIDEFKSYSSTPDSFLAFFDYCFEANKPTRYNMFINMFMNVMFIFGWLHLVFIKILIPILHFLSTQVNF